jgi:acyl transferase domain-containing protein
VRDGDPVRAVIRGSAVNSDGKTPGITMPSLQGQVDLIRRAYAEAGLETTNTTYVEAHGTGTAAGDTIEARAIATVFGKKTKSTSPVFLASVKSNLGHLEGASGIAGVIKAILVLENGRIPPHLNFQIPREGLSLDEWNIKASKQYVPCRQW